MNPCEDKHFSSGLLSCEQCKDFLKTLIETNNTRKDNLQKLANSLFDPAETIVSFKSSTAKYIMQLCDNWKLSDEVKFTAIEMYDNFLSTLLNEIHNTIFGAPRKVKECFCSQVSDTLREETSQLVKNDLEKINYENQQNQWQQTITQITRQMELRAVSCISIASKLNSHYGHVTIKMTSKYLITRGYRYREDVLLKSEIRVLKTLNYNLSSLPLVLPYIGVILDILINMDPTFEGNEIYEVSMNLLSCFYPRCCVVYAKYCKINVDDNHDKYMCYKWYDVANDTLLLSCGILADAVYLWMRSKSDQVVKLLCDITGVSEVDIARFAYILLDESLIMK